MMINRALLPIFVTTLLTGTTLAEEIKNYLVASLSTELHRVTISSRADAYAVVNCNALVSEGELDWSQFDREAFQSELAKAADKRESLLLSCRTHMPLSISPQLGDRIHRELKQLARNAGYQEVRLSQSRTSAKWENAYRRSVRLSETTDAQEPLIENEWVRLFPIRTSLSKFVHGDADCLIEVMHPIDGRMEGISPELESAITEAVKQAELTQKHTLVFRLSSTEAGRDKVETFFDSRSPPIIPDTDDPVLLKIFTEQANRFTPSPALALAQRLGFQKINYTHSPGGGAPEKLIGSAAPSFKLTQLSGDELQLKDAIQGRPALITFWGLACGPCRKEAPHLSRMHQKYGKEFAIFAVNGYDDGREAVAKYVAEEQLTHPIVLQGGTLADDVYQVGAYPTTFWVDRTGTVVGYEVGFSSAKRLEAQIEMLLKPR